MRIRCCPCTTSGGLRWRRFRYEYGLPPPAGSPHRSGVGSLCWPHLAPDSDHGAGRALAGFDRLGNLDMKRSAVLIVGLSLLIPYLVGVITHVGRTDLDIDVAQRGFAATIVGVLPGFFAEAVSGKVGVAGAVLLGFLALSALTLATFAWHPLQRLERGGEAGQRGSGAANTPDEHSVRSERRKRKAVEPEPAEPPAEPASVLSFLRPSDSRQRKEKKAKKNSADALAVVDEESDLPPVDLLTPPSDQDVDAGEAQLDRLGNSLIETLRTFKVEGRPGHRTTGPVVTQFEVLPAPGVKAGRIGSLADDLAIAMRVPSVRVAPIPGKGAVGVEIPNPTARIVTLRELIESDEWQGGRAVLPIALGHDLEGKPVIADLTKMPHLLIAGATGTGKSVTINTIITSLIYRYTQKHLRFLMIDPKMVELSMYNALPHLRHKVVTNNHDAATVLKWAVLEMQRRYELLQANGARNVADFNRKVEEGKPLRNPPRPKPTLATISAEAADTPPEPPVEEVYSEGVLPFIVMIIDELADLMMTVQGEVETPLAILAQKARAIGIHLILATQRPSVNVITGLIKANFPSRIAFRVASKVDSRTILDQNGSEALLGKGDMLFLEPGKSEPMRLQGAYISTEESEKIMERYRQWKVEREHRGMLEGTESSILDEVPDGEAGEGAGEGAPEVGERDPQFKDAAIACVQNQGGSTSLLQRKLGIGYGRAARIMDQLEEAGILGPANGSKPRDVRIGIDQIEEYCN